METLRACDGQRLYSGTSPLVQREVISSGPARKEKLLTMSPWPLLLSPLPLSLCFSLPPFSLSGTGSQVYDVKLFPEDPVELIVGEDLTLNCTAMDCRPTDWPCMYTSAACTHINELTHGHGYRLVYIQSWKGNNWWSAQFYVFVKTLKELPELCEKIKWVERKEFEQNI